MKNKITCLVILILVLASCLCIYGSAEGFLPGDMNGDNYTNSDDAIQLLRYTLGSDKYPVNQNPDVDRNGYVGSDDAIYLLRYTLSSSQFPISCEVLGHEIDNGKCLYCGFVDDSVKIEDFNSDVNYLYLATLSNSEKMCEFYNALDSEMTRFHTDVTVDAQIFTQGTQSKYMTSRINYANYGLSSDEAVQVWQAYKDDHPLYYWMITCNYTNTEIITVTYDEYVTGASRAAYNELLLDKIKEYIKEVGTTESDYETALVLFDKIIENCDFFYTDGTIHYSDVYKECTIVSPLLDNIGFFSGYARLYQILLNYYDIENWYAWNSSPLFEAWNLVKLDDGRWYWFDIATAETKAWDTWDRYQYFCGTASNLPSSYQAFTTAYSPTAPQLSSSEFSINGIVEINSNFSVNSVMYKLVNGEKDVIAISYNHASAKNIGSTITYNGVEYNVLDYVDYGDDEINTVLFESNESYKYLSTLSKGSAMKKLYEEFDVKFTLFHLGYTSNAIKEVVNGNEYYLMAKIDYAKYGLSYSDAMAIWQFYRMDHPLYYWSNYSWVFNKNAGCIYPTTVAEYDTVEERNENNEIVYRGIMDYVEVGEGINDTYSLALSYYDEVIDNCKYSYDSNGNPNDALWAHSIIGAFINQEFVCEGYAKILHALYNYNGIENRYITGYVLRNDGGKENHAWNLVKFDDGAWYWCDATWGDSTNKNHVSYMRYFCGTSEEFGTHVPNSTINDDEPSRVIPTLPSYKTSGAYNDSGIVLGETFVLDGKTYRRIEFDEAECVSGQVIGERLPDEVVYDGVTYTVVIHSINNIYWYRQNNVYMGYCQTCKDWVNLYDVNNELFKLTFESGVAQEASKYEGFSVVSPERYNIVNDSSGSKVLACGDNRYFIDVDRQVFEDLRLFAITFDLKITQNGISGNETSIISFLSNYQNGSQISGKTVGWGWLLKYNVDDMVLETVRSSELSKVPAEWNTRINISKGSMHTVTIIFEPTRGNAYVIVDNTPIGMVYGSALPDFSDPSLDNALSIRLNDSGNCAPVIDNLRIFELS